MKFVLLSLLTIIVIGCEKQVPVVIQSSPQNPQSGPHCVTYTVTGIGRCIPNPQQCGNLPWCETVWNYNTMTLTCGSFVGMQKQICQ